jgi:hypothetical protein
MENAYGILVVKLLRKQLLGRLKRGWDHNIKINIAVRIEMEGVGFRDSVPSSSISRAFVCLLVSY